MRESYRLNKHTMTNAAIEGEGSIDIVFMYVGSRGVTQGRIAFEDINSAIRKLITVGLNESRSKS
jgi:hypothetical protein